MSAAQKETPARGEEDAAGAQGSRGTNDLYHNSDTADGTAPAAGAKAARFYADRQFRVVPVSPTTKKAKRSGFDKANPTYSCPPADFSAREIVGLLCGPCPALGEDWLLGLDLDDAYGADDLTRDLGPVPTTLTSRGQRHWLFRVAPGPKRDRLRQWNGVFRVEGGALDLRWSGGYLVERGDWDAPFDARSIAELPAAALDALIAASGADTDSPRAPVADRIVYEESVPDEARFEALIDRLVSLWPQRERHDASFALGGVLAKGAWPDDVCMGFADAVLERTGSNVDDGLECVRLSLEGGTGGGVYGIPKLKELLSKECPPGTDPDGLDAPDVRVSAALNELVAAMRPPVRNDVDPEPTATAAGPGQHPAEDCTKLRLNRLTGWPWILQKGQFYWLHHIDQASYRQEVPTAELIPSVARNLDKQIDEEDRTRKKLDNRWIRPVSVLKSTYTARANTYDPQTNSLTLAALQWTRRPATFHPHIDRWLRALFGDSYDAAAQWIASLGDLSRPAPALYMAGEHELGKSLLADGLASLWGQPKPATLAEVISDFNEATASCPLVFGDEGFPPGLDFNRFREMITEHSRRVNQKHRAKVSVEGCARVVIAANNDDALRYQKTGTLTRADLDAIADRLLVIVCKVGARAEVAKLDTAAVASHELAEHALWIAESVPLQPKGQRMAAKPGGGDRILQNVMAGRQADVLLQVREARERGHNAEEWGVKDPTNEPSETWINVTRLFDSRPEGSRMSLADIKEFCETHRLAGRGVEQHNTTKKNPETNVPWNLKWRILDRASLDEALGKLD